MVLFFKIYNLCLYPGVADGPYWVLSTDYQSYSLVYSCSDFFGVFNIDFAWILARTRTLTEDAIKQLHEKLTAAGVNVNRLEVSNQTACDVMVMTWPYLTSKNWTKKLQSANYLFEL